MYDKIRESPVQNVYWGVKAIFTSMVLGSCSNGEDFGDVKPIFIDDKYFV